VPEFTWTQLDEQAVATARALAMDAVQKVGNGHPGTAMALAPAAYLLFQRHMRHDPNDPKWMGRDRFVLSCGHSSLTLYTQLYFSGYGLSLDDLKAFRTQGSLTPGHPEYGHTTGVETTTGPLGAGVANAVGMAMSQRYWRQTLDSSAAPDTSPFDHHVWVIASDGDLEEGVSAEASSLAGTQALGNLTVIYDANRISIEGDTHLAFTEDVALRYRAYGWHTIDVPHLPDGNVDITNLDAAMTQARAHTTAPTLIVMHSVIAWPAPHARGTSKSHGSALGADEVAATKVLLGMDPDVTFHVSTQVLDHVRAVRNRGAAAHQQWLDSYTRWREACPDAAALLDRLSADDLPNLQDLLPTFDAGTAIATRAAFGVVVNALAPHLPELWGGSSDLAESNNTSIHSANSFLPASSDMPGADPAGRVVHFGIREHAMGGIINGIALDGLSRPFGGTFLVFSDYMRGAVRLAALMGTRSSFIWTHDSIGLGEDGPTHQPVEHLWALRGIPRFSVVRPADANETAAAFAEILRRNLPAGLILSRQALPVLAQAQAEGVARGGYVIRAATNPVTVVIIATGSEVTLSLDAAELLEAQGEGVQVVSMPCVEWFHEQPVTYRDSVLPPTVRARVAVEAGGSLGWWRYVGDCGAVVAVDDFGASTDANTLFGQRGFTADNVAEQAVKSIAKARRI